MSNPGTDLPLLQAGPTLPLRKERVDVPELGGSVIVRGLTASEAFAVDALRRQATQRIAREAAARRRAEREEDDDETDIPELTWQEWMSYGASVSQMLHVAVLGAGGLSLYTAEEWEAVGQHHPAAVTRLQTVVERLSGMNAEDVQKNSTSSPT